MRTAARLSRQVTPGHRASRRANLRSLVRSCLIEPVSERRAFRVGPRTDQQILQHPVDMFLLAEIQQRRVQTGPENRMDLRRLARDDLILAGFGRGAEPTLLARGVRLLQAAREEYSLPPDDSSRKSRE